MFGYAKNCSKRGRDSLLWVERSRNGCLNTGLLYLCSGSHNNTTKGVYQSIFGKYNFP